MPQFGVSRKVINHAPIVVNYAPIVVNYAPREHLYYRHHS